MTSAFLLLALARYVPFDRNEQEPDNRDDVRRVGNMWDHRRNHGRYSRFNDGVHSTVRTFAIENANNSKSSANDQKTLETSLLESELKVLDKKPQKPYINGSDVVSDVKNGIVYDIGYVQGDVASPQKKLLSILDLDSLEILANIPEEFYKDIKVGSAASITPVADKSRKYRGKVTYISGKAINSNGETQIPVRISIEDPDGFLHPGFNVDVSISIYNH